MQIYLPIAEISVDPFVVMFLGAAVGFLSGMFGVGGGFLMTPLLIFYGIPPAVAVGTEASQIVASSVSGVLAHIRRRTVDFAMGGFLVAGGSVGAVIGILIFRYFRDIGQIETFISISYVIFLGVIGALMLMESVRTLFRSTQAPRTRRKHRSAPWMAAMPFAMRFRTSQLYISPIPPIFLGFCVGILASIMGVGGGFIMVPAMLYILNMPTNVVVGTSLFQIIFVTAIATVLHAAANQTVDIILALLLLTGGVIGAQFGARAGRRLKGEQLRALLALIVLAVCARLLFDLALPPVTPFVVEPA
ncbi:MAG: sulfite exporter TauE/SafE family protein [Pseudomonadota bacterium]